MLAPLLSCKMPLMMVSLLKAIFPSATTSLKIIEPITCPAPTKWTVLLSLLNVPVLVIVPSWAIIKVEFEPLSVPLIVTAFIVWSLSNSIT